MYMKSLLLVTSSMVIAMSAFAQSGSSLEESSASIILEDGREKELSIIDIMSVVPPKKQPITTVRLKNDKYDGCIAIDKKSAKVRLWGCGTINKRYDWVIWESYNSEQFYFVNHAREHRCLALKSDGKSIRGYGCNPNRYRLWKLRIPGSNENLTADQVKDLNNVPGYNGQLLLVNDFAEECLGTVNQEETKYMYVHGCFQIPDASQVFNVHPPGPIN